jgi:hypothetical protein
MSDTDSSVLPHPLLDRLVGSEIGQMKLVHKVKSGIFLRKKLYSIIDYENKEIVRSSGIDPKKLSFNSFEQLLKVKSLKIVGTSFRVE